MTDSPTTEKDPNAELRAFNERLKAENASLRARTLEADIRAIGLDPEKGLGVAVAEMYEGDFSQGSVKAFAQEKFGHSYTPDEAPPKEAEVEKAKDLMAAQAKADRVTEMSSSTDVTPDADIVERHDRKLAQADASRSDAIASAVEKYTQFRDQINV